MPFETPALQVVAAIIHHDGYFLALRRAPHKSSAGKWEFPGGKLEVHESSEDALAREIYEELGLRISVGKSFSDDTTKIGELHIRLECFLVTVSSRPDIVSTDHDAFLWLERSELLDLDWAEPDLPAVRKLVELGAHSE